MRTLKELINSVFKLENDIEIGNDLVPIFFSLEDEMDIENMDIEDEMIYLKEGDASADVKIEDLHAKLEDALIEVSKPDTTISSAPSTSPLVRGAPGDGIIHILKTNNSTLRKRMEETEKSFAAAKIEYNNELSALTAQINLLKQEIAGRIIPILPKEITSVSKTSEEFAKKSQELEIKEKIIAEKNLDIEKNAKFLNESYIQLETIKKEKIDLLKKIEEIQNTLNNQKNISVEEIDSIRKKSNEANQELTKLQSEIVNLKHFQKQSSEEYEKSKKEIEKRSNEEMMGVKVTLASSTVLLKEQNDQLQKNLKQKVDALDKLAKIFEEQKDDFRKNDEERISQITRLKKVIQDSTLSEEEIIKKEKVISNLNESLKSSNDEIKKIKEELESYKKEVTGKDSSIKKLQEEYDEKISNFTASKKIEIEEILKKKKEKGSGSKAEIENIKKELLEAKKLHQEEILVQKKKLIENEVDPLKTKLEETKKESKKFEKKLSKFKEDYEKLITSQGSFKKRELELNSLKQELETKKTYYEDLETSKNNLSNQILQIKELASRKEIENSSILSRFNTEMTIMKEALSNSDDKGKWVEQQMSALLIERNVLQQQVDYHNNEILTKERIKDLVDHEAIIAEIKTTKESNLRLEKMLTQEKTKREKSESEISNLKEFIDENKKKMEDKNDIIISTNEKLSAADLKIIKLTGKEDKLKTLEADHAHQLNELKKQMEILKNTMEMSYETNLSLVKTAYITEIDNLKNIAKIEKEEILKKANMGNSVITSELKKQLEEEMSNYKKKIDDELKIEEAELKKNLENDKKIMGEENIRLQKQISNLQNTQLTNPPNDTSFETKKIIEENSTLRTESAKLKKEIELLESKVKITSKEKEVSTKNAEELSNKTIDQLRSQIESVSEEKDKLKKWSDQTIMELKEVIKEKTKAINEMMVTKVVANIPKAVVPKINLIVNSSEPKSAIPSVKKKTPIELVPSKTSLENTSIIKKPSKKNIEKMLESLPNEDREIAVDQAKKVMNEIQEQLKKADDLASVTSDTGSVESSSSKRKAEEEEIISQISKKQVVTSKKKPVQKIVDISVVPEADVEEKGKMRVKQMVTSLKDIDKKTKTNYYDQYSTVRNSDGLSRAKDFYSYVMNMFNT